MQSNADQPQAYNDLSNDEPPTYRTVPVPEAARILGISPEAVRSRIQRGTLRKHKATDGTVYVRLDTDHTRSYGHGTIDKTIDQSGDQTHLVVASLEDQISFLRAELVTRNEELRRKDHIIAALTERIPLKASPSPREGHATASEEMDKGPASPEQQEGSERRSWLHRFFFGP